MRSGKLADNIGFGRALRRAGVPVDASRMALAQQAAQLVGLGAAHVAAAGGRAGQPRGRPRAVPRAVRGLFPRPRHGQKLLAQMLPTAQGRPSPAPARACQRGLAPARRPAPAARPRAEDDRLELDAAMTASAASACARPISTALGREYQLVERWRAHPLPLPRCRAAHPPGRRRAHPLARRDARAARSGGELLACRACSAAAALPLLVLVDVSGSMERYARLLLAFLARRTRPGAARGVCLRHRPERSDAGLPPGRHRCHAGRGGHRTATLPAAPAWAMRWPSCAGSMRAAWWAGAPWCC
jgi:uncharacterized protein with von Willebrand factor type A (vWA) domain